jgi:hypothetical protein
MGFDDLLKIEKTIVFVFAFHESGPVPGAGLAVSHSAQKAA